jgi:hypothetical protein
MTNIEKITIVCRDSGHERKQVKLLTFYRHETAAGAEWSAVSNWTRAGSAISVPSHSAAGKRNGGSGNDNGWAQTATRQQRTDYEAAHGRSPGAPRPRLNCSMCGDDVVLSRPDKLNAVLTQFAQHGVANVPLTALRAAYTR